MLINDEKVVLAAASTYDKKYYFNDDFEQVPQSIQDELKIICVLHTAEVGGIITVSFDEEGSLIVEASADEEDVLYDEIGSHLKVKQLLREHKALWESLEKFFEAFY